MLAWEWCRWDEQRSAYVANGNGFNTFLAVARAAAMQKACATYRRNVRGMLAGPIAERIAAQDDGDVLASFEEWHNAHHDITKAAALSVAARAA